MAAILAAGGEQRLAFLLGIDEVLVQDRGIGVFEIVAGKFLLGLQEDIAIGNPRFAPSPPLKFRS